ncbi:hypothetical protein [Tenacibaculum finnmarkense]|uniref:hypothetical protein n=1 Tax=Tenacibaculum finnmarkense TaxID=2781243 RepID=UPI00187B95EC|nr:hypothetical protein [Tenacibaculum finnmarkense]MBE7635133.1 hypothetical protein [Tenacibaculum finnmarkense genomovar ulcerans]MBE7646769.1 hypothetical protein [Tenacibaculum finnmarkense genomovar ulcerans]MCD8411126.1 hypothetical protein [Tenacibaculum finnmarkense genomovar ulcerans]MCD8431122.1 hypothetical protein [Tenacibaculum finnmarkense genomovar ulcerans]MCD8433532.1 hypothetical protein [Tenacibaculum finnmarkense genomovar ulcerans]
MNISSFHLVKIPFGKAIKGLFVNLIKKNTKGLIYSEYMTAMTLGSPILSPSRFLIREIAIFAQWENEKDLEYFLEKDKFGEVLNKGWHVRLGFMRDWGNIEGYKVPKEKEILDNPNSPVAAVTIARMKPLAVPRFLNWGRPVEKLVRDHSGTLLSLASFNFPNTISTFTIWKNVKEMENMVHGHSKMEKPKRHSDAMKERERKSFHFEFTTLRFKPLSEYGSWKGKSNYTQITN